MATKVGEEYQCEVCGNWVHVVKGGDGELVCCGQPMKRVKNAPGWAPTTPYGP